VVCPGVIFGPGDIGPTPSGQLIIGVLRTKPFKQAPQLLMQMMRGKAIKGMPPMYVDGGTSLVDVRDVAEVHALAAERGRPNGRYIATAHNVSQGEFVEAITRAADLDLRFMKIPEPLARRVVARMERQAAKAGTEPVLSSAFFEYSLIASFFSNQRSVEERGATYRPLDETLRDAVEYFRQGGYIA